MNRYIPLIVILIVTSSFDQVQHWKSQTCVGVMTALGLISLEVRKKSHWSAALLFFLSASSAAFLSFTVKSPYVDYGQFGEADSLIVSAQSLVFLLAVTIPILLIKSHDLEAWLDAFCFVGILSSTAMIIEFFAGQPVLGFLSNPSLDATFLALTIPFILSMSIETRTKIVVLTPIFFAIAISKSNTGFSIIVFETIFYLIIHFKRSVLYLVAIFATVPAILAMHFLLGNKFLVDNGRFTVWKITLAQFIDRGSLILGNGSGMFAPLSEAAQRENGILNAFPFAHNEPLQVLFEQGILGIIILVFLYMVMISGSTRKRGYWLTITVLSLGVASLTQPMFRTYPFALFCALICRMSLIPFSREDSQATKVDPYDSPQARAILESLRRKLHATYEGPGSSF